MKEVHVLDVLGVTSSASRACPCGAECQIGVCVVVMKNGCPYAAMTRDEFKSCIGNDDRVPPKIVKIVLIIARKEIM